MKKWTCHVMVTFPDGCEYTSQVMVDAPDEDAAEVIALERCHVLRKMGGSEPVVVHLEPR